MAPASLTISLVPGRLAICRLDAAAALPEWAASDVFSSATRTPHELSVVCPEDQVPPGVRNDRGWRALKLEGPLDLSMAGIIASLAAPLAEAGIPIFSIATYETDYLLVRESQLKESIDALAERGHTVRGD